MNSLRGCEVKVRMYKLALQENSFVHFPLPVGYQPMKSEKLVIEGGECIQEFSYFMNHERWMELPLNFYLRSLKIRRDFEGLAVFADSDLFEIELDYFNRAQERHLEFLSDESRVINIYHLIEFR